MATRISPTRPGSGIHDSEYGDPGLAMTSPDRDSTVSAINPKYQSLLDANPYKNQEYKQSWWQRLLSGFGFRTSADKWREQMNVQSAEYDASIAAQQYAEEYNDPLNETARLRAAGINPDLNGGQGVSAGEAQTPGVDMSVPDFTPDQSDSINEFLSAVGSAVSTAFGLVGSMNSITAGKLSNRMLNLQSQGQLQEFAKNALNSQVPGDPYDEYTILDPSGRPVRTYRGEELPEEYRHLSGFGVSKISWKDSALQRARQFGLELSKKEQAQFSKFLDDYFGSAEFETFTNEKFAGKASSSKKVNTEWSEFYSPYNEVMSDIYGPLGKASEEIYKLRLRNAKKQEGEVTPAQQNSAISEAKFDKQYYETADAGKAAESENKFNEVQIANNDMLSILRKTLDDMIQNLKKSSEDGGIKGGLASTALVSLAIAQLQLSSNFHPTFSRSSTSNDSLRDRGFSENHSRRSSMSIGF